MSQRGRENNGDGGRGETPKKQELSGRWQREQVKKARDPRESGRHRGTELPLCHQRITAQAKGGEQFWMKQKET